MSKKLMAWVLALVMVLGMLPVAAMAAEAEADLVIEDAADLLVFAGAVNGGDPYEGKTVTLTGDINLSEVEWTPIGNGTRSGSSYTGNAFKGTFDGGENTITGLTASLFGIVDGGTVSNVDLEAEINETVSDSTGAAVAVLVGGTVENVNVTGSVTGIKGVGGVVGRMLAEGEISGCTNAATVSQVGGNDAAGGIVGKAYYTRTGKTMDIITCSNAGAVSSPYCAGGIAGLSAASVYGCENTGDIESGLEAGGIVGEQVNYGTVSGNTNTGDITNGDTNAGTAYGGIIGWIRYQTSTADYEVSDLINVCENDNSGSVIAPAEGDTNMAAAGGIVGLIYNQAMVNGNTNTAETITGRVFAGGIVGGLQGADSNKMLDGETITVAGNISDTALEDITANCVDLYAYNNASGTFVVKDNVSAFAAEIDGEKYITLQAAVNDAAKGDKIVLLTDIALAESLVIDADDEIVLELNGKKLSGLSVEAASSYVVENKGKLTVQDSSEEETGLITTEALYPDTDWDSEDPADQYPSYANNTISNRGVLILESGTIENTSPAGGACYAIDNYDAGSITVNGGAVSDTNYPAIRMFAGSESVTNSVTITGGTVTGTRAVWMQLTGTDTTVAPKAELTVTGGKLISSGYTDSGYDYRDAIYCYGYGNSRANAKITISDNAVIEGDVLLTGGANKTVAETVTITGGTFKDPLYGVVSYAEDDVAAKTINISGGTFEAAFNEAYLAEGYEFTEVDGVYVVREPLVLEGEGTEEKPYLIHNAEELKQFRDNVNGGNNYSGKYVQLADDIELDSALWTPIGNTSYDEAKNYAPAYPDKVFSGVFDGNGKTIFDLKIKKDLDDTDPDVIATIGLFGTTGEGAVIKDLTITNVDIDTTGRNVGALVGFAYKTTMDNITVDGNIQIIGGNNVSGVCAMSRYSDVSATNITVKGDDGSLIKGNNIVGGLFAEIAPNNSKQTFSGLSVENVAIEGVGGVGGIVGLLTNGAVSDVTVKDVALTGNTKWNEHEEDRIRLGSVSGLLGSASATISDVTVENVTAKNLEGEAVDLPVIGANYDAASNATEAKIGDKYYNTLATAFGKAEKGDTIELLADVTLSKAVTIDEDITLDLSGKTITVSDVSGSRAIVLEEGCTEFVLDAKGGKIVSADALSFGIIDVNTAADVTVNGGTYDYDTDNGSLFKFRAYDSEITLDDVTVETNGQISGPNYSGNVLDVNGGSFKAENGYDVRNVFAFYVGGATATFDEVTIDNDYIGAIENWAGTVTVTDCDINVTGTNSAPYLSVALAVEGNGTMTVDGGTYTTKPAAASDANGQGNTHGSWTAGIMSSGGTLIINDGTFSNGVYEGTASNPRAVITVGADADYGEAVAADLQIKDGTFSSIGALIDCETIWGSETDPENDYMPTMEITITDGDFTGVAGKTIGGCDPISTGNPVDVDISGGTYSAGHNIDASYLAEGYKVEANEDDGTYSVVADPAAQIGTETFATLQAAVDAAGEGDTVVLLRDVEMAGYLNVTKDLTLDLSGFDITRKTSGTGIYVNAPDALVTIQGEGTVSTGMQAVMVAAGKVEIKGGTFVGGGSTEAVNVNGSGEVHIYAGTFSSTELYQGQYWVLNLLDDYRDTASITVYGGSFLDFNPADNLSEGKNTNFVAEGYEAVLDTESGMYQVSKGEYTITFETDGGSAVESITAGFGAEITAPADPTKDGYTFEGWLPEIPATMPVDGLTVTAQWSKNVVVSAPANATVTEGVDAYAYFTVEVEGEAASYQWQWKNAAGEWVDSTLSSAATATLRMPAEIKYNGRQFQCVVTGANGTEVISAAAILTVNKKPVEAPSITAHPNELNEFFIGANGVTAESLTLTAAAEGENLTLQWQYSTDGGNVWKDFEGANETSLTIPTNVTTYHGYQFRLKAVNESGKALSKAAEVYVTELKAAIDEGGQPESVTLTVGDRSYVEFTVAAEGQGVELSYQWQWKSEITTEWVDSATFGYNTETLRMPVELKYSGRQFRCEIKDTAGDLESAPVYTEIVTLTVEDIYVAQIGTVKYETLAEAVAAVKDGETILLLKDVDEEPITISEAISFLVDHDGHDYDPSAAIVAGEGYTRRISGAPSYVDPDGFTTLYVFAVETVEAPVIVEQPEDITAYVEDGGYVYFSVEAMSEADDDLTHQWQYYSTASKTWVNSGASGSKTPVLTMPVSTTYNGRQFRCEIKAVRGELESAAVYTDTVTLTVDTRPVVAPVIVEQPEDVTVTEGDPAIKLTVEIEGEYDSVQWQFSLNGRSWSNTGLTGNKGLTLTVPSNVVYDGRQFKCVVTYAGTETVESEPATVTVEEYVVAAPKIVADPEDQTGILGVDGYVWFEVEAEGEELTYQWQWKPASGGSWEATNLKGYDTAKLRVPVSETTDGRRYRCIVTNEGGVAQSAGAQLTVEEPSLKVLGIDVFNDGTKTYFEVEVNHTEYVEDMYWEYSANKGKTWPDTKMTGWNTFVLEVPSTATYEGRWFRCVLTDIWGNEHVTDHEILTLD